jgi:hypothetical protein
MSRLRCTERVRVGEITPALAYILYVLEQTARVHGKPKTLWITAIANGQHMSGSRHYRNEAVDLFVAHDTVFDGKHAFIDHLKNALGEPFTVLLESEDAPNEHIHIQPKKGTTYP